MDRFISTDGFADKYERLRKASGELSRINAQLVATLNRHNSEIAELVAKNQDVLRRCEGFLAAEQTNGNGASAGDHLHK